MHFLPVIADHPDWKIENQPTDLEHHQVQYPLRTEFVEVYSRDFGKVNPHMNFIGIVNGEAHCVFSVMKNPTVEFPKTSQLVSLGPSYKALMTDPEGYEQFYVHNLSLQRGGTDPLPVFEHFLNHRIMKKDMSVYAVTPKTFIEDLINLEKKFSRRVKAIKVAVLFVKPGQTEMKQIFQNQPSEDSRFFTFMDQIASRVKMNEFKGYRGDMGNTGDDVARDSYTTIWRDINIMFHIAPYMNAEQHRRLVGNDIPVIIYNDTPDPTTNNLTLFGATDLGIVPHVFSVVEPHPTDETRYRLGFFSRATVPTFGPPAPPLDYYFKISKKPNVSNLRDFLFTKLHNGLAAAQSVSPLNRLYTVPRREALKDLIAKYPPLKNQKLFDDFPMSGPIGNIGGAIGGAAGAFGGALTGVLGGLTAEEKPPHSGPKLKVKLFRGRNLAPKDSNGLSDPYCRLVVGSREQKSQIIRKTLCPCWEEEFEFDVYPEDDLEEFHLICMDWDKMGGHDFMGEYHIYIKDLPLDKDPVWFPLLATTAEAVSGEIELQFSYVVASEESDVQKKKEEDKKERGRGATISIKAWGGEAQKALKSRPPKSPRNNEHAVRTVEPKRKEYPVPQSIPELTDQSKSPNMREKSGGVMASMPGNFGRAFSKLPRSHTTTQEKPIKKIKPKNDEEEYTSSLEEKSNEFLTTSLRNASKYRVALIDEKASPDTPRLLTSQSGTHSQDSSPPTPGLPLNSSRNAERSRTGRGMLELNLEAGTPAGAGGGGWGGYSDVVMSARGPSESQRGRMFRELSAKSVWTTMRNATIIRSTEESVAENPSILEKSPGISRPATLDIPTQNPNLEKSPGISRPATLDIPTQNPNLEKSPGISRHAAVSDISAQYPNLEKSPGISRHPAVPDISAQYPNLEKSPGISRHVAASDISTQNRGIIGTRAQTPRNIPDSLRWNNSDSRETSPTRGPEVIELQQQYLSQPVDAPLKEEEATLGRRARFSAQGRSMSSEKVRKPVIAVRRESYSLVTTALDDVKNAVEELLFETIQPDINRHNALKSANEIKQNLQQLALLFEDDKYEGPFKTNIIQMINLAKHLLKNCLEYVKLKLSGQQAAHILPALKENSEEFRKCVLNATKLALLQNV